MLKAKTTYTELAPSGADKDSYWYGSVSASPGSFFCGARVGMDISHNTDTDWVGIG
jgi:hypothetical protein